MLSGGSQSSISRNTRCDAARFSHALRLYSDRRVTLSHDESLDHLAWFLTLIPGKTVTAPHEEIEDEPAQLSFS
jgi:hypothetical protein